jgi:hypothetical protein
MLQKTRVHFSLWMHRPKTLCPTRAPNTPSMPPHKSTPSALLYAHLPAPRRRRAPPCPRAAARLSVSVPHCPPQPCLPDPLTPPSSDPLTLDRWPHRRCRTLNRLDAPPLNPWRLLWLEGLIRYCRLRLRQRERVYAADQVIPCITRRC